jgi:hypothetical protein
MVNQAMKFTNGESESLISRILGVSCLGTTTYYVLACISPMNTKIQIVHARTYGMDSKIVSVSKRSTQQNIPGGLNERTLFEVQMKFTSSLKELSVFINDLPSVLPPDSTVLFADDTAMFIVSDSIPALQSSLQTCLNLANLWLEKNGLKLNASKTKSMIIHSYKKLQKGLMLCFNGHAVDQVCCFKYLGVLVNDILTWSDRINMICNKVTRHVNLLR